MPASAACEMASEKKAIERSVTNTPTTAHRKPTATPAIKARCMNG